MLTNYECDVTTLDDDFRHYILGIQDVGGVMNFTFLYEKTVLSTLNGYKGVHKAFKVEFPDGVNFTWEGYCAPSVVGKGVNDALQINLGVVADTDIEINFPSQSEGNGTNGVTGASGQG